MESTILLSCKCHDLHHAILGEDFVRLFLERTDTVGMAECGMEMPTSEIHDGHQYNFYDSLLFDMDVSTYEMLQRIIGDGKTSQEGSQTLTILERNSDNEVELSIYVRDGLPPQDFFNFEIYKQ